jgi:hypothetical protein
MPGSAAIYSRRTELPFIHELKAVAPGAVVSWDVPGQLVVEWPGVRVVIEQLPPERLTSHLEDLLGFLQERCTLHDTALVRRIGKMRQCVSLTFEPEADAGGRCVEFLRGLAGKLQGVYFQASSVHAPDGKLLASPRPGTPAVDFGEARRAPREEAWPREVEFGTPPSPLRVARRALVLAAVVRRAFLDIERWTDCQETHLRLLRWLDTHELMLEAEHPEALMLESPVYTLEQPEIVDGVWRTHGVWVLAWALGLGEVPVHDVEPRPAELTAGLGLMTDSPRALAAPVLRSPEELQWLRRRLVTVRWRLREVFVKDRAMDLEAVVRRAPPGIFNLEGIPLTEGDLAIEGVPLVRANPRTVQHCLNAVEEQLRTLHWPMGQRPLYSQVDIPT